jgi:hypothetical protein
MSERRPVLCGRRSSSRRLVIAAFYRTREISPEAGATTSVVSASDAALCAMEV